MSSHTPRPETGDAWLIVSESPFPVILALGSILPTEPHGFFLWLSFMDFAKMDNISSVTPDSLFRCPCMPGSRSVYSRWQGAGNARMSSTGRVLALGAYSLLRETGNHQRTTWKNIWFHTVLGTVKLYLLVLSTRLPCNQHQSREVGKSPRVLSKCWWTSEQE